MPLPELIEVAPLSRCPRLEMSIPGSKSITNRALILAALAEGTTRLTGALWSEDTQVMTQSLRRLGFRVEVEADSRESANRTILVEGQGGRIPRGGSEGQPLELEVANAGTAARFLSALVCLGSGYYRLSGVPRMHQRPQRALFEALRQLGYQVDSSQDRLPVMIRGGTPNLLKSCQVDLAESSQFASALLLCARSGGWSVEVSLEGDAEEAPYVRMTRQLIDEFPRMGGEWAIEPDASSASYFWAIGWLSLMTEGTGSASFIELPLRIRDWPTSDWQVDARFPRYLPVPHRVSRNSDLGDSILTAMVVAADEHHRYPTDFIDLGRLRVQECERVEAMRIELTRCGGSVLEAGNSLRVIPGRLHGAVLDTYQDHRMAMCWATLGLKIPGIKIRNPACVGKTFPNFFYKLAAPIPDGLGASIWECDPVTFERRSRLNAFSDLNAD